MNTGDLGEAHFELGSNAAASEITTQQSDVHIHTFATKAVSVCIDIISCPGQHDLTLRTAVEFTRTFGC